MKALVLIALAVALVGCSSTPETAAKTDAGSSAASGASGAPVAIKRYEMHGKIVSVDAPAKSARIDAGPIGDWMGAMTMNYTIKDDAGLAKLSAGSTIDATVFVQGDDFWVGEIKAPGASAATGK